MPAPGHPPLTPLDPIERILLDCLEQPSPSRGEALARACSDHPELAAELRERFALVEQLEQETQAPEFPAQIGPFDVLARLGGGGMGVVYRARERELGREVALKVVRPELLHFGNARERFRREVEAVARLQHPAIVPVYSVGEADGLPWLAMELVRGASLGELLTDLRGRRPERLIGADLARVLAQRAGVDPDPVLQRALFAGSWIDVACRIVQRIAEALAHAHGLGILHRDVKPSNVMLTAEGQAKLVDFGLALRTDAQKLTRSGTQLGTDAYMSPEQVRGEELDPRSDVYALGVVLYELLALREAFVGANLVETQALVLGGRCVPLRQLNRTVPWDVETICSTAMDLDRRRRYRDAQAFAADLGRWLRRESIVARRPGLALRARRWVERHPTVAASALLGTLLLVGLPSGLLIQERAAREEIEREAEVARRTTAFLVDLFDAGDPRRKLGNDPPASQLVETGLRRLQGELRDQPEVRAPLLIALGRVLHWLGREQEAAVALREGVDLMQAAGLGDEALTYEVMTWIAHGELGDVPGAITGLRGVLARMRERGRPAWEIGHCMTELGYLLLGDGRLDDAEAAMREGLALQEGQPGDELYLAVAMNGLGQVLYDRGDTQAALGWFEQTLALRQQIYPHGHPQIPISHYNVAECHKALGNLVEAERRYATALQEGERINGPDHPAVAAFLLGHAEVLQIRGDLAGAEPLLLRALAIREHSLPENHQMIAWTLNDLGTLRMRQGDWAAAVHLLGRAVAIYTATRPNHLHHAIALDNLARAHGVLGDRASARRALESALETSIRWVGVDGGHTHRARQALLHHHATGGELDAAQALLAQVEQHARGVDRDWWLGQAEASLALLHAQRGEAANARPRIESALARMRSPRPQDSHALANAIALRGWVELLEQDFAEAEACCREAIAMFDRVVPHGHEDLAYPLNMLGTILLHRDAEAALPVLQRTFELRQRLLPPEHHWRLVSAHNYATVLHRLGRAAEARPLVEQAIELRRGHTAPSAIDLFAGHVLATSVTRALDDPEAALRHAAAAHELARSAFATQPWHIARAANTLAELQWSLGRAEEAAVTLTDAEEFVAKLPEQHAERREAVRIRGLLAGR